MSATQGAALPPRAGIALLTLQLRAARQEAAAAEEADAARQQLRARLGTLMDERRRALDVELEHARAEAAASVQAAHRAASVMVTRASSARLDRSTPVEPTESRVAKLVPPVVEAVPPVAEVVPPVAEVVPPVAEVVPPVDEVVPPVDEVVPPVAEVVPPVAEVVPPVVEIAPPVAEVVPPVVEITPPVVEIVPTVVEIVPTDVPTPISTPAIPVADAAPGQLARTQPTGNLIIDAESFATMFATVVATILDQRLSSSGGAGPAVSAAPAPTPVKQSFWTHARHPDVILLGLTTIIVLVVLAAWLA